VKASKSPGRFDITDDGRGSSQQGGTGDASGTHTSAREQLNARYARGDLTRGEYLQAPNGLDF
jgi:uncharacterized membrane protein